MSVLIKFNACLNLTNSCCYFVCICACTLAGVVTLSLYLVKIKTPASGQNCISLSSEKQMVVHLK